MSKVSKIVISIPEMDDLNEEKEQSITTFLEEIRTHYKGTYPPQFMSRKDDVERRILAYKYLKARHWVMKNAIEMVTTTMTFREEEGIDTMEVFPCAFPVVGYDQEDICRVLELPFPRKSKEVDISYRAISPFYTCGYHFWDKEGHPVFYDFSGRARVKELLKSVSLITRVGEQAKDTLLRYHIYVNAVQEHVVNYADAKSVEKGGRRILGSTVVLDTESLHLGMVGSQILDVVRSILAMDQKHYPEVLHRLLVINCPSMIMHAFGLLKGSLDAHTQAKVVFCSQSESKEALKRIIDEDKIPQFLGGCCSCADGCMPGVDCVCEGNNEANCPIPRTEDISVAAGKRHVMELKLQTAEEVQWEFKCTRGRGGPAVDIQFQVTFELDSNGSLEEDTSGSVAESKPTKRSSKVSEEMVNSSLVKNIKSDKLQEDKGQFAPTEGGVLRLVWDNRSSWLHGKHVQMCVSRAAAVESVTV